MRIDRERPDSRRNGRSRRSRAFLPIFALAALSAATYAVVATEEQLPASDAEKIAEASSSAPVELAVGARILDWPQEPGGELRVIREGTNGWSCVPDYPGDASYAPECFDEEWLSFLKAYLAGEQPSTERVGLSYMLSARWAASNTDRTATEPTADNQWHEGGSHLMLVVPDPAMLEWFPTDPTPRGGAYVMYGGTPYAHLMIPVPEAHATQE